MFVLVNSANYCDRQSNTCKCSATGDACTSPEYCLANSCEGKLPCSNACDKELLNRKIHTFK